MTIHLVIGDAHSKPGVSNARFNWLGRFVRDIKPDVVIDMGDWEDMPSLSSYDKGKRSFEGRRYHRDIAAGLDARNRYKATLGKDQFSKTRHVALGGNHGEGRIDKVTNLHPELHGTVSLSNIRPVDWEYVPFLNIVKIDGINYSHYFTSGVMGRPCGGESPGLSLIKKQHESCVSGHSHVRDFSERTSPSGRKIFGLSAGCYFEHYEDWAGPANMLWWRGLVVLNYVDGRGYADPAFYSIRNLRKEYYDARD